MLTAEAGEALTVTAPTAREAMAREAAPRRVRVVRRVMSVDFFLNSVRLSLVSTATPRVNWQEFHCHLKSDGLDHGA